MNTSCRPIIYNSILLTYFTCSSGALTMLVGRAIPKGGGGSSSSSSSYSGMFTVIITLCHRDTPFSPICCIRGVAMQNVFYCWRLCYDLSIVLFELLLLLNEYY